MQNKNLRVMFFIIILSLLFDVICSFYMISKYKQQVLDSETLFEGGVKDFSIQSDHSLISQSDDPWISYILPLNMDIKAVDIIVDSVSKQNTWAQLHFILDDDKWIHESFYIHDGINKIKFSNKEILKNVKTIRFDLVNQKELSIKIDKVIINNSNSLTVKYHIICLFIIIITYIINFQPQIINHVIYRINSLKIKELTQKIWYKTKKSFGILMFVYIIGLSSLLRANFNYIDDMERVAKGSKGWDNYSRYLSNFLSSFIHADTYLSDVSPLPQIIAIMLLTIAGIISYYVISEQTKFTLEFLIALIPLGLSPYFLECLSYKFDSPYMALSVLVSVMPLLFYRKNIFLYFIISVTGTIAMCTTYQASSGIFPMLVVLLCMKKWTQGEQIDKIFKLGILSFVSYLFGLIFFRLFIMHPLDSYASTSVAPINQLLITTYKHLIKYYTLIKSDLKKEWIFLIILLELLFIYNSIHNTSRKKLYVFLISIMTLFIMHLLSFGIYPLLEKPSFSPRGMYGFGVLITFIGIYVITINKNIIGKFICFSLSWGFFVFAFTYGNALYVQRTYVDFRINLVIEDLNNMELFTTDDIKTVQISGTCGLSPVLENMPQDYQILNRLVPVTFRGYWYWGQYGFFNYYGIKNIISDTTIDMEKKDYPIIKDTMYHTIKGIDNHILIELK